MNVLLNLKSLFVKLDQKSHNSDLQKDYEMALLLDQQENDRSENSDFLLAQIYERQQAESIKYLLLKGKIYILMIREKKF